MCHRSAALIQITEGVCSVVPSEARWPFSRPNWTPSITIPPFLYPAHYDTVVCAPWCLMITSCSNSRYACMFGTNMKVVVHICRNCAPLHGTKPPEVGCLSQQPSLGNHTTPQHPSWVEMTFTVVSYVCS